MENQPGTGGRPWFRLASMARMEQQQQQQQQPQPAQPPRGPPIRQASIALGRPPLLAPTNPPPSQTVPTQTQPPPPQATSPQNTTPPPPSTVLATAAPAPPNAEPSPATPPPAMTPQPKSPPTQPQVPLAQKLQQSAQTTTASDTSVEVPKELVSSSPSSPPPLRPIITTRAPTPESPKVIKTSLPTPLQSTRITQPTVNSRPNPEPEPRTPTAATLPKNILKDKSDKNGKKFNNNGEGVISNHSDPKLIMPQADVLNHHPSPGKEERHLATYNGKDSYAKASNIKDEKEMRMITIAGENLGAWMDLGSSYHDRKYQLHHKKVQESEAGNEDGKASGKISNAARNSKPMFSLTNSNVQCVNNSILFNASSAQRNPGVHITFNRRRQPKNTSSSIQDGHPRH